MTEPVIPGRESADRAGSPARRNARAGSGQLAPERSAVNERQGGGVASPPSKQNGGGMVAIRGSVDIVNTTEIRGWAFANGRRAPVLVTAMLNHEILGEAMANIHRSDLESAGLGDGKSGYVIRLFRPIDPLYFPFLVVKVDGGDAELPRAPMLGFGEFFSSLYLSHPAVGRSRSLLGGLWTDRTDAASLLRGKTAIGQIAPAISGALSHLIQHGFAIVDLAQVPPAAAWNDALGDRAGDVLDDSMMLAIGRVVLEDSPLIVNVALIRDSDAGLAQPSASSPSPSPAECIEVIVPLADGVTIDVARDSHRLPEFTPHGVSRWTSPGPSPEPAQAAVMGFLDSSPLEKGKAAVIGPGTLYRVRVSTGAVAARILCLPGRGLPIAMAYDKARKPIIRSSGVRSWI
jgi:hypothetical protein